MSNRFKVETITDLNQITKTGWYSGGNIAQINQYMTGGWNIINAAVQSDNSARISVFNKQGLVLDVNRDGSSSYTYFPLALKSDLIGRFIYVAGDGGTQNFNIGNNGSFLLIPYSSTTFVIYYLGTDSVKLILGTEDSNFKVSISGTTCMLQNNKGWNIFCVFITGQ